MYVSDIFESPAGTRSEVRLMGTTYTFVLPRISSTVLTYGSIASNSFNAREEIQTKRGMRVCYHPLARW